MPPDRDILARVGPLLARMPEWVRHDLGSKEAHVRARAEESLAMMIEAALRDQNDQTPDQGDTV